MTNGAKILITIAIIITLGIVIHGKIKNNAENVKENKSSNSDMMRYFDEEKNTIQINHYWTKAWDVYEKKRRMTDVFFKENPKLNMSYFYEHEYENRSADYTIFRFLMQLKLKLGLYKNK